MDKFIPFECNICNQLITSPITFAHHHHTAVYKGEKVTLSSSSIKRYNIFVPSRQKEILVKPNELTNLT